MAETRIKQAIRDAGLDYEMVASLVNFQPRTVESWALGERQPGIASLRRLSEITGKSVDWLTGRSSAPPIPGAIPTVRVPLLGSIQAGVPIPEQEDRLGDVDALAEWNADFALRVSGDSMEPRLSTGDTVFLRRPTSLHDAEGRMVAAIVEGTSTLKWLLRENSAWLLRAENLRYKDIPLGVDPEGCDGVQGVVVGVLRDAPKTTRGGVRTSDCHMDRLLTMLEESLSISRIQAEANRSQAVANERTAAAAERAAQAAERLAALVRDAAPTITDQAE